MKSLKKINKTGFSILWGFFAYCVCVRVFVCLFVCGTLNNNSLPLKDLPHQQEAHRDGDDEPQVGHLGEHLAIVVLQVSPAIAFGEPQPVLPHQLPQPPQRRQHPAGGPERGRESGGGVGVMEN